MNDLDDVKKSMRYAPVKVTRIGNDVRIIAFIRFTGDANDFFPDATKASYPSSGSFGSLSDSSALSSGSSNSTSDSSNPPPCSTALNSRESYALNSRESNALNSRESNAANSRESYAANSRESYAQVALKAIMNIWKGSFIVGGRSLKLETIVYSKNQGIGNLPTVSLDTKQRFIRMHIGAGARGHLSSLPGFLSMRSHEGLNIIGAILNNESILSWSLRKSSSPIVIYDHVRSSKTGKMEFIGRNWFEQTVAHEFGHALGLGDAYNAGYRGGKWAGSTDGYYAPYSYQVEDDYGNESYVYVPDNDIMLQGESHNYVSDNDVRMVLEAHRTGKLQLFPWGSKCFRDRHKVSRDIRS